MGLVEPILEKWEILWKKKAFFYSGIRMKETTLKRHISSGNKNVNIDLFVLLHFFLSLVLSVFTHFKIRGFYF